MSDSVENPLAKIKGSSFDTSNAVATTTPAPATMVDPAPALDLDKAFQEKHSELIKTLESLKNTVSEKEKAALEAAQRVADFENKAKEAERSKMSDVERIKAEMIDQQKQLQDLLKTNIDLKNKMAEESIKNMKYNMLAKSGLRDEFHKFVHASDPVDIQKQIDDLVGLQNSIKNEALSSVPSTTRTEVIGTTAASSQSQQTPPAATSDETNKYKGVKDVKDLAALFYKDPAARAALLNKR